jgi:hypothetical protein
LKAQVRSAPVLGRSNRAKQDAIEKTGCTE